MAAAAFVAAADGPSKTDPVLQRRYNYNHHRRRLTTGSVGHISGSLRGAQGERHVVQNLLPQPRGIDATDRNSAAIGTVTSIISLAQRSIATKAAKGEKIIDQHNCFPLVVELTVHLLR